MIKKVINNVPFSSKSNKYMSKFRTELPAMKIQEKIQDRLSHYVNLKTLPLESINESY